MKINKTHIYLIIIVLLAFTLRIIASANTDLGTDELTHATRAIDIIKAGRISTLDQVPLWLYLTNIGYSLFGINGITARLPNIIFGSLSCVLIFLIGKEIYNETIGLISSFLFAISSYAVMFNVETDMLGVFFMLFSIYYYIKSLKINEKYFLLSALFLGLAILSKNIAMFILPIYLIFFFIYKKKLNRKTLKYILLSAFIVLIFISPIIIYNYLLYVDKGIADIVVTRSLNIKNNVYENYFGGLKSWSFFGSLNVSWKVIKRFFITDLFITSFALIGMIALKKNKWNQFLLLSILIIFFFLTGTAGASKSHYLFIMPMLCLFAGKTINKLKKIKIKYLLIFILAFNIFIMAETLFQPSGMLELKKIDIEDNALVITDSRILTGKIAWIYNNNHYLEADYFPQILQSINNYSGDLKPIPIYFIECINRDCGWGQGIRNNKELQNRSNNLVNLFKENSKLIEYIDGKQFDFNVYKTTINFKESMYDDVDNTHQFFFYPVRWRNKEDMFDYYTLDNWFEKFLEMFGLIVLYLSIIITLISPFLLYRNINK